MGQTSGTAKPEWEGLYYPGHAVPHFVSNDVELQRFMEWLDQTGEADILAKRAASRAKIVKVIAAEYQGR
jgi:hypothetical protein